MDTFEELIQSSCTSFNMHHHLAPIEHVEGVWDELLLSIDNKDGSVAVVGSRTALLSWNSFNLVTPQIRSCRHLLEQQLEPPRQYSTKKKRKKDER